MNCNEDNSSIADPETVADALPSTDVPPAFRVADTASANWVIRKVIEARAYADRVKRWAELELRRADREEQFFLGRFGAELEAWARAEIANLHDGRKSLRLPSGMIGFRTAPPSLLITDENKLLEWAQGHLRQAVEVRRLIRKSVLLEHLKLTGECPIGAEIRDGDERMFIG